MRGKVVAHNENNVSISPTFRIIPASLNGKGSEVLNKLEDTIGKGYLTYWTVGETLWRIKEEKLFLMPHSGMGCKCFSAYLKDRWVDNSNEFQIVAAAKGREIRDEELAITNSASFLEFERNFRMFEGLLRIAGVKSYPET
jgi:hypothetical protein